MLRSSPGISPVPGAFPAFSFLTAATISERRMAGSLHYTSDAVCRTFYMYVCFLRVLRWAYHLYSYSLFASLVSLSFKVFIWSRFADGDAPPALVSLSKDLR